MKISASIYSDKKNELPETLRNCDIAKVDYLHVDCNNEPSVFNDIKYIKSKSQIPIDLHIISPNPHLFYPEIKKNRVENVAIQYEDVDGQLHIPDNISTKFGLAITKKTSLDVFYKFEDSCSFVLFMTTTPGQSGGTFDQATFERIRKFQTMFPNKKIHVDGGVDDKVAFMLKSQGVYCAVSGSYLVNSTNMTRSMISLSNSNKDIANYKVRDFMSFLYELPILYENEATDLISTLEKITYYKTGFAIVIDSSDKLIGIITDGDIRRHLIKFLKKGENLNNPEFLNKRPITILEDSTIDTLIDLLGKTKKPITFVPVINKTEKLVGAISFSQLIKGVL